MPELPVPPAAAPSPSSLLAAFALRTWPALSSANDELPASSLIPTEPDPLPLCSTKVCKSVWPLQPLQFPPGCVQAQQACGKIVLVTSEHAHDELNTRMPTVPALVGNTRHQSLATRTAYHYYTQRALVSPETRWRIRDKGRRAAGGGAETWDSRNCWMSLRDKERPVPS